ncbi:MAG: cyclin-like protein [Piptocephalis tieghemiana]|nr:MAG: cyclin-like protein [Piptocephalis tieghemiana]
MPRPTRQSLRSVSRDASENPGLLDSTKRTTRSRSGLRPRAVNISPRSTASIHATTGHSSIPTASRTRRTSKRIRELAARNHLVTSLSKDDTLSTSKGSTPSVSKTSSPTSDPITEQESQASRAVSSFTIDTQVSDHPTQESSMKHHPLGDSLAHQLPSRTPLQPQAESSLPVTEESEKEVLRRVRDELEKEDQCSNVMMAPYTEEIYINLRLREEKAMPNPKYMTQQTELTWEMRMVLIQWMIEVHEHLKLRESSLYLAVNMVDRFLSVRTATPSRLQLLGTTALFTASAYHWFNGPYVHEYLHLCQHAYSKRELFKAQRYILDSIDWELNVPHILPFLLRGSRAERACLHVRAISLYLSQVALVHPPLMAYPPSQLAASCLWLARTIRQRGKWDQRMSEYTWYGEVELYPVVEALYAYLTDKEGSQVTTALYGKFAHSGFLDAAGQCEQWIQHHPDIRAHFLSRRGKIHR